LWRWKYAEGFQRAQQEHVVLAAEGERAVLEGCRVVVAQRIRAPALQPRTPVPRDQPVGPQKIVQRMAAAFTLEAGADANMPWRVPRLVERACDARVTAWSRRGVGDRGAEQPEEERAAGGDAHPREERRAHNCWIRRERT